MEYYHHDLTHYIMQTGRLGRMQVLNTIPVCACDVINFNMDAFVRLSPMRKPVEIPLQFDMFAFYAPNRWACPLVDATATAPFAKPNAWAEVVRRPFEDNPVAAAPNIIYGATQQAADDNFGQAVVDAASLDNMNCSMLLAKVLISKTR